VKSGRNQPGDMGHIHHDYRADGIGYCTKPGEVDDARIGARADHYHFRAGVSCGQVSQLLHSRWFPYPWKRRKTPH
jgi:hypothetical protein